jgi:2,5-diamino-6-(ribosylamino)-4(3H)-pyrimidinone 5'-phosphate reductase
LSTQLKEKEEKILKILEKLAEECAKGKPVVVEGKKDVDTLFALGVQGKLLTVKTGGKSFLDVVSEIEKMGVTEVILFLDFDRRGKEGTKHLKQSLERIKIKPNTKLWRALSALVGREIQCIESLTAYLLTLRRKIGSAAYD